MDTIKALATTVALAASGTAPGFAAVVSGGHGAGAHAGGFRSDDRSRGVGGWGVARVDSRAGWRSWYRRRHDWRGQDQGYAYGGYPYAAAGYGYWGTQGPGPFGPPPYGGSFAEGPYGQVGEPMAALAPMAYGPGAHDGAYAYGYNGYAQTPPLPQVGPSGSWQAFPGARVCGC